jgi:hypothetical protein
MVDVAVKMGVKKTKSLIALLIRELFIKDPVQFYL